MIFSYRIRHFELQPEMYYQRKKGWEKNPWVHNDMWNIKILKITYFFGLRLFFIHFNFIFFLKSDWLSLLHFFVLRTQHK